jgi:hypothetical protein
MTDFCIKILRPGHLSLKKKKRLRDYPNLFYLVPRAGLEPARWGATEGF